MLKTSHTALVDEIKPSLRCQPHLLPLLANPQANGSKRGFQPVPAYRRDRRLK